MTDASAAKSMWAIPKETSKTPLSILKEQASALTEQTDGLLRGDVSFIKDGESSIIVLHVVVPTLDNYRVEILKYYQPITLFPGHLLSQYTDSIREYNERPLSTPSHEYREVNGIEEFETILRALLSSRRVSGLLSGLLAQSQAATQY